ncbi:MAG: tRNA (5-methylaminomethyl-2-thiouridylate)-methyltransferase [Patescibacteria group bacterium]|nr:tRNA (5-methylaminomethyl-2-thiouridylate)-methyltransferase [Patescibacteria group bacterium]
MSGGVDSSVTAALLQREGFEVEGMFMKNWSPETIQSLTDCPWEQDQADAAAVCEHLGIPFRSINFEKEYKERVVDYFLAEYAAGRTPNPDIMCNKEIKFKAFLAEAEKMGADLIATGHYVQKHEENGVFYVKRGVDPRKDQSYFLWTLSQAQLSRSLFPLGSMQKSEVRKLAEEFGLPTATKKDSQGICFIGHIDLKKFLMEQISSSSGSTYLLPSHDEKLTFSERMAKSVVAGKHQGALFYTYGERGGAVLDNGLYRKARGNADVPSVYVVHKDSQQNALYVSEEHNDPDLYSKEIIVEGWQGVEELEGETYCQVRYQQQERSLAVSLRKEGDKMVVNLQTPLWGVAAGQSLVLYHDDLVMCGGTIAGHKKGNEEAWYV